MRVYRNTVGLPGCRRTLTLCLAASFDLVTMVGWPGGLAHAQPAVPSAVVALPPQPVAATPDEGRLTQPQLEQLLAPVALYPDELLAQMLMAATYPLELVQASAGWAARAMPR